MARRRTQPRGYYNKATISTPPHTDADEIGQPGPAEIPGRAAEHRRGCRTEPGEECKPPEIAGLARGQLGDQCLSPRPGERHGGAVDQLQHQQAPEPWHQGKQRRQNHAGTDKEQSDLAGTETIHQHADVDRQKHRHDRARAHQDANFGSVESKRQRVKRHQKGVEINAQPMLNGAATYSAVSDCVPERFMRAATPAREASRHRLRASEPCA